MLLLSFFNIKAEFKCHDNTWNKIICVRCLVGRRGTRQNPVGMLTEVLQSFFILWIKWILSTLFKCHDITSTHATLQYVSGVWRGGGANGEDAGEPVTRQLQELEPRTHRQVTELHQVCQRYEDWRIGLLLHISWAWCKNICNLFFDKWKLQKLCAKPLIFIGHKFGLVFLIYLCWKRLLDIILNSFVTCL